MAYLPNIPQPGDRLKDSQPQILANFQALEPFGNNFALFNVLAGNQTTNATQMAIYAKISAFTGAPELFMERQGGTPGSATTSEFTYKIGSANGETELPSGIILKWGGQNLTAGINPVPYPTGPSFKPFSSQVFQVIACGFSGASAFTVVVSAITGTTGFSVISSAGTGTSAFQVRYLAIGI